MNIENILWVPIVLKIGALLFIAFLVLLIFKTIQSQHRLKEMTAEIGVHRVTMVTNVLPVFVAILAGVAALWVVFSGGFTSIEIHEPVKGSLVQDDQIPKFQKRIDELELQFKNLQQTTSIVSGIENGSDISKLIDLIAESKTNSEKNSKAIKSFESLILSDAEKLLTLPLLKRDLNSIDSEIKSLKSEVSTLRTLMAESSSQNRWLIGTLAFGMLALVLPAIRSIVSGGKNKNDKEETNKS